jgi:histidinol dehydrogenase
VYGLGPRFNNTKSQKGKEMRSRDEVKKLVIEIDQQYPEFSELCTHHKWDMAIEIHKAGHPELHLNKWAVDSIGDPVNRKQAHEMFVKLHAKRGGQTAISAKPTDVWLPFHVFVDMWLLTYPKKASKASVRAAVKEFIKDKDQWTPDQVKSLQDTIEAHTNAYTASFNEDIKYMVSPANYFAAEKWTEKVSVKYDKSDVNYKSAGAPARPNMPSVTTIKAN